MNNNVHFRRIIAWIIDWNLSGLPCLLYTTIFMDMFKQPSLQNIGYILIFILLIFLYPITFVSRDVIFKGRSLGKRILGLYVYDKNSLGEASVKQLFLRNIFFFLYFIDGIVLLVSGQTIGDRVAGTLVISKQGLKSYTEEIQVNPPVSKKKKAKKVILVLAIIIGCLIAFIGLIQVILNTQKDTEEYKVAYSYFTESQAFKELNVDESEIRFNHYSSHTYTSADNDSVSQTVEIGFLVNFKSFEIVCHKENGVWQVCDECTLFE